MVELKELVTKWRRDLHKIPELGLQEYKTAKYIREQLEQMGLEYRTVLETGTIVYLNQNRAETIAFRTDIDALQITEANEISFKSTHTCNMHACGHDGHTAAMLAFAKYLSENNNSFNYNVLLIFQPAEESPGAAKDIVALGILDEYNVKAIFGMHLMPSIDEGVIACRPGPLMAECGELHVTINGQSAHAGLYHQGVDTIMIASHMIQLYKNIITTSISPLSQCLVHIGMISGGSSNNIVAGKTQFHGTVRTYSDEDFMTIQKQMKCINKMMEQTYNCSIDFTCDPMYPPVLNDHSVYEQFKSCVYTNEDLELKDPLMLAEDFSFYQTKVPGVFFFLGTKTNEFNSGLHTETFNFNEEVLLKGVQAYINIINNYK